MSKLKLKINFKINYFKVLNYLYPLSIVLVMVVLVFIVLFLYQNVYKTISYAQEVTYLKQKVSEEDLKKTELDKILEKLKEKTISQTITELKDPFTRFISQEPEKPIE